MPEPRFHVLVADDHPLIGWALTQALEPLGFSVSVATTRTEACGRLFAHQYSHVVMSIGLGQADMLDVLEELSAYQHLTRLVVLTVPGSTEHVREQLPSAAVLEKPFNLAALVEAVHAGLAGEAGDVDVPA